MLVESTRLNKQREMEEPDGNLLNTKVRMKVKEL